jgi:uncharacterized protein (TIGR03435 family)
MRLPARVTALASIVAVACAQLLAQGPPASFEAVSIKPQTGQPPLVGGPSSPDRFEDPDTDLLFLIRYAYDLFEYQVVGGPGWVRSKRWQVSAKASAPARGPAMRALVRRMLEDRFALKTHMDMRELPIYNLVLARTDGQLGPKIKRSTIDCMPFLTGQRPMAESPREPESGMPACSVGGSLSKDGLLTPRLNGQPLSGLVRNLEASLQRRVVDRTGLQGNFDISLGYVDDNLLAQSSLRAAAPASSEGPSLMTALQEQLGMRLESARGPVEVLVIDSVSEPAAVLLGVG